MRAMEYFSQIHNFTTPVIPNVKPPVEEVFVGLPILNDAVNVTLAEYDVTMKNAITAHHLKDYRRKVFNLKLLPKINLLFDEVLKGSDYWRELLQT